jgi:hypothetical protein
MTTRTASRVLFLVMLVALPGCVTQPQTPLQRVTLAKQTFTVTGTALTQLIDAGKIAEADKPAIHEAVVTIDGAIQLMELAALNNNEGDFRSALAKFNEAMDALIAKRIAVERGG